MFPTPPLIEIFEYCKDEKVRLVCQDWRDVFDRYVAKNLHPISIKTICRNFDEKTQTIEKLGRRWTTPYTKENLKLRYTLSQKGFEWELGECSHEKLYFVSGKDMCARCGESFESDKTLPDTFLICDNLIWRNLCQNISDDILAYGEYLFSKVNEKHITRGQMKHNVFTICVAYARCLYGDFDNPTNVINKKAFEYVKSVFPDIDIITDLRPLILNEFSHNKKAIFYMWQILEIFNEHYPSIKAESLYSLSCNLCKEFISDPAIFIRATIMPYSSYKLYMNKLLN